MILGALGIWLAAASVSPASMATPESAVATIFAPYSEATNQKAAWEHPVYSRDLARLIDQWRRVAPPDEPDALSDGDWLCLCQDWDATAFRATVRAWRPVGDSLADVEVVLDLGGGQRREARLLLRRQSSRWLLDNLFADDFPQGLKQALRETIRAGRERTR